MIFYVLDDQGNKITTKRKNRNKDMFAVDMQSTNMNLNKKKKGHKTTEPSEMNGKNKKGGQKKPFTKMKQSKKR